MVVRAFSPVLERQKQADLCKFKDSQGSVIHRNSFKKTKEKERTKPTTYVVLCALRQIRTKRSLVAWEAVRGGVQKAAGLGEES